MRRNIRMIFALLVTAALACVGGATPVVAQEETAAFPLPTNTAFCEPGYAGPFDGCTPWDGVVVSYESEDGTFAESCATVAGSRTATCTVDVPFGSTITVSINPAVVPAGYVLERSATQSMEIPATPPDGVFGGAAFVLLPEADDPTPVVDGGDETASGGADAAPEKQPDDDGQNADGVVALPNTGTGSARLQVQGPIATVALIAMAAALGVRKLAR